MVRSEETKRYSTMRELMEETGFCWPTVRKLADEAEAVVKVGRRVLIISDKFHQYLCDMAGKR